MEGFKEKSYAFQNFTNESIDMEMFTVCTFANTDLGQSKWRHCIFVGCDFQNSSFNRASFDRCIFRGCDFAGAFLDHAQFSDCRAIYTSFENVDMGDALFGFSDTKECSFDEAIIRSDDGIPFTCREVIAEMVRQISEDADVQAFAALIKSHKRICWELLIKFAREILTETGVEKVLTGMQKYPKMVKKMVKYHVPELERLREVK